MVLRLLGHAPCIFAATCSIDSSIARLRLLVAIVAAQSSARGGCNALGVLPSRGAVRRQVIGQELNAVRIAVAACVVSPVQCCVGSAHSVFEPASRWFGFAAAASCTCWLLPPRLGLVQCAAMFVLMSGALVRPLQCICTRRHLSALHAAST